MRKLTGAAFVSLDGVTGADSQPSSPRTSPMEAERQRRLIEGTW
ncbi:hypothetical protein [Sphingomonas oligophenolica]|nr:hypothetical protein [Sphingomonas oligophenolica]